MNRILIGICFIFVCLCPFTGKAEVTLPWSCDFDSCPDWVFGQTLNCCGLRPGGPWACNGTGYEEINSLDGWGGSGKSQVHWVGAGDDNQSGGLVLDIAAESQTNEIWFRYYIKYQPGFSWGYLNYNKHIYINLGRSGTTIVALKWGDEIHIGGGELARCKGCGWRSVFSDNQWHCIEVHLKYGAKTGIKELWIDGVKKINAKKITYGDASYKFSYIHRIGSNQLNPNHSGCKAIFFDNLAISATGPIGPISVGTR